MIRASSLARRNPDWRGLRHTLDPDRLPCVIDLVPPRWTAWLIVAVGLGWMLLASNLVGELDLGASALSWVGLVFPAIGLAFVAYGLRALFERRQATFRQGGVEVTGRSLGGRESWSLRYGAFRGVLHREHVVRRKNSSTTWQIVELVHDDPGKTLPLSVEPATEVPRALWERYARAFDRPAMERDAGRLVERQVADLDKSVRALAAEGKLEHRFDPSAPPPKGLAIAREENVGGRHGQHLRITVTAGRVPPRILALFAGLAATVLLAAVAVGESPGVAALAVVFLLAVVLVHRLDRRQPRQLLISRRAVTLIDAWQGTGPRGKTLEHDEIEDVGVRAAGPRAAGKLVIAGDKGNLTLGGGLSRPALDWLANYLTAAIVTA